MNDKAAQDDGRNEQQLAHLIRTAGARAQPPAPASAAVREVVAAEWRQVVAERARRRTLTRRWSAAAAVLVAGLAVWLAVPRLQPDAALVAAVARTSGAVEVRNGAWIARWVPAQPGASLAVSAEVRAAAGARAALQFGSTSVRLDENSAVALLAPDRIALKRGAIYVDDVPGETGGPDLIVETAFGNVRHLGTQYEARLSDGALRVRVREGRVQVSGGQPAVEGRAGEQLTLLASGELHRGSVARADGEWAWIEAIAPDYDINDRPLLEFLRWVSRETGRGLSFGSPGAEATARDLILRGSVKGMAPRQALAAVLTTTDLRSTDSGTGLRIDFHAGD